MDSVQVFAEVPQFKINSVSRPNVSDITPMHLSYNIEFQYKEFKWLLKKKGSQVLYLHLALRKRVFIEGLHEKQDQVKEWIHNLGLVDDPLFIHDDDEDDDMAEPFHHDDNSVSIKYWNVPTSATLSVIKPALERQHSMSDRAMVAMQGYLSHFFRDLKIVNSREVCRFLEVSQLSFSPKYGPKLKEGYVSVKHLPKIRTDDDASFPCNLFSCCCNSNWQKVWAVLKPGFLAFLQDPFDTKPLDIVIFDMLPPSDENSVSWVPLAKETKERNPLWLRFEVSCVNRTVKMRRRSRITVKDWVRKINDAALRPHRHGSFAPPRGLTDNGSRVQWFIDGAAAFAAIATSIEEAESEIFITDWWLCPELYMRRPFDSNKSSRLDALLEARASQGVKIYILLYQEVTQALKINSMYSERQLLKIHENVKVLRYPDHFQARTFFWSNHEKIVIVDNQVCYIGGLDLCFGRYDTPKHKVSDFRAQIWPGKDYYNPRESEPNSWEDTMRDELDRSKYPRMPWHDVQCALWGPPCLDVARHFVQRWNFAKRKKAPNEQGIPLLMPQNHMVFDTDPPSESEVRGGEEEWWGEQERGDQVASEIEVGPRTTCRCQVLRSVGHWSAGTSQTEESLHNAYISLIEKSEHFVYIENQFFISGLKGDEIIKNRVLEALYSRIVRAYEEKRCFRVIIVLPLLPGFPGGIDDGGAASVRAIMDLQYRTICRGQHSILQSLYKRMGNKADDYISFYGLRTYGRLSDGGPLVTNQIYVHSKLMLVDDRIALIGSANINDRSLVGYRDSEIGVLIEDKEVIDSQMDGKPWKAGKFTFTLRLSLWSEHLGFRARESSQIIDPVAEATYKSIWMATAKNNTLIYQDVFSCVPNDLIRYRSAFRHSMNQLKEKIGHNTVDLGIMDSRDPMERLNSIKGHIVCFPLEFMCQEKLLPNAAETEFYVAHVFH